MKSVKVAVIAAAVVMMAASCGQVKSLSSIKQVGDDQYLYKMDYCAKYDLDEVIEADIDANTKLLDYATMKISHGLVKPKAKKEEANDDKPGFSCTSFQAKNAEGDGYIFGRNYDYCKNPSLVLTSHPKDGFASISVCDLSHLGCSLDKVPNKLKAKIVCLAAIYAPMDGINEKGLCVSIMALPKQAAYQDTGKHKIGTSMIMRLWLDRCSTVQEALDLLATLDLCHDQVAGSGYHYLVADANGDAAIVEFDLEGNWETMITRKPADANYLHVTNHLMDPKYYTTSANPNPKYGNPHSHSWMRYDKVSAFMNENNGTITSQQAEECLSSVHWVDLKWENGMIEDTQWSNVYDQSALTLTIHHWSNYNEGIQFNLK